MAIMNKYIRVMRTSFTDLSAYWGDFIGFLAWGPMSFVLLVIIWSIVYSSNPQAPDTFNYSINEILGYSLIVTFIGEALLLYKVAWGIQDDNLDGTMTIYLCRPVNYLSFRFAQILSRSLLSTAILLPVVLLLISVMELPIILDPLILVGFLISIGIGYILSFLCFALVGTSTFYIRQIWPIRAAFIAIMQILGGELLPVDLLPSVYQSFVRMLPFYLISFMPAQWVLGRITIEEFVISLIQGVFWILILVLVTKIVWSHALKKFESAGG
ncbi:MAG: ABC transporter permease [Candidatus Heimdallarchaeota archaeon]